MDHPNFIYSSYESQSPLVDQERTVNWYPERVESPGGSTRFALYPTPGVTELVASTSSPGRAHFFENGLEVALFGTSFTEISQAATLTVRGTGAIGTNPGTIYSNGDGGGQLFVTTGDNGYVYDRTSNVFTQVATLNGEATMGGHLDGYFLALDADTSKLRMSDLLDGLTWDPTQFAQRSRAPDPWSSMMVVGIYIWLLGQVTSEVWYDTGASPFPFAPYPSLLIPYGIAAPFSAAVADGSLIWLGASAAGNAFVLRAQGFAAETISTSALQNALSKYGTISDAVADVYNDRGHTFYLLHFPTENVTWAYDLQTGQWAERATWNSEDNEFVAWRPRFHAMAFGEHRMLDAATGSVYRMSSELTTDVDMRPIRRMRRAPSLTNENQRLFFPGFELDLEAGLGTSAGQGEDPQVMLRMSNDGGKTWGSETMRSAGKIGQYLRRVRWNRCGSARKRVFEVTVTDPIAWRLVNAYLTPDPFPLQQQRGRA